MAKKRVKATQVNFRIRDELKEWVETLADAHEVSQTYALNRILHEAKKHFDQAGTSPIPDYDFI